MAKIDILRFIENVPKLFAPSIVNNQVFIAYTDESKNSFNIQGDNISSGGSGASNSSVERLEQSITTLQATVDSIQSAINEDAGSSDTSILTVDDIVYDYYSTNGETPPINPSNVIQLKGRPFLTDDNGSCYLAVDNYLSSSQLSANVELSSYLDVGKRYAGFRSGKIYTTTSSGLSSIALNNGDVFFNKTDSALYTYDAGNHKFVKISGKRQYVVDYIVDYIGQTLPNNLSSDDVVFFEIDNSDFYYSILHNHGRDTDLSDLNYSCCFANIQSTLNNDASIYSLINHEGIRVTHDLYDGDTVYNKEDGCTYTFTDNGNTKSFIKTTVGMSVIPPVCDILLSALNRPDKPSNKDDKCLSFDTAEGGVYILPAASDSDWAFGTALSEIEYNEYYAALDTRKVYKFIYFGYTNRRMFAFDIPVGATFFNKADNSLYLNNGSTFIKISNPS